MKMKVINNDSFLPIIAVTTAAALLITTSTTFLGVSAATVKYNLTLNKYLGSQTGDENLSPDCSDIWEERRWLYLGKNNPDDSPKLPGPLIEANEGDLISITVKNENDVMATTVHWHGLHQVGTVWNDGTSQITQCSLNPYEEQTYEFIAYPPGTHFWHSHQGMTQTDGVTGPIIIHPKEKEPYDYDEERLLFLGDFFDQTSLQRCAGLKSDDFEWIGDPTSLLLNGKGLSQYCTNFNGTQPDGGHICLDSCSDTKKWTPSILIEAGKTYRFRFINGGGLVMQNIAINGHTMTVVNVDGTNVEPFEVDNLSIAVGQRYSVLVKADQYQGGDNETKNFWMQSVVVGRPSEGMPEGNWVLSYANSTDDVELPPDTQEKPNHPAWDDQTQIFTDFFNGLHTRNMSAHIEDQAALTAEESDIKRYQITITQAFDGTHLNWALNNISFVHPTSGMPLIGSAVEQSQRLGWPLPGPIDGTIDMPRKLDTNYNVYSENLTEGNSPGRFNISEVGTSVIRLNKGDIAEIIIDNSVGPTDVSEFHPWHFHGHYFWVVGRGNGTFNETEDVPKYNLKNPVLRDTSVGLGSGWLAVRFVANNPGVWFFHCHIEAHLTMGMGTTVVVSPNEVGSLTESVQYCDANKVSSYFQDSVIEDAVGDSSNGYSIINDHHFVLSSAGITTLVIVLLSLF